MPEKTSSFEGLFDGRQDTMPRPAERNETGRPAASKPKAGKRELGKRSNPDYKQFSVLLKKRTHMDVSHTLDILGGGQDFSDLVQQLLEQWLKRLQKKTGMTE
jgi:hypothetical protein